VHARTNAMCLLCTVCCTIYCIIELNSNLERRLATGPGGLKGFLYGANTDPGPTVNHDYPSTQQQQHTSPQQHQHQQHHFSGATAIAASTNHHFSPSRHSVSSCGSRGSEDEGFRYDPLSSTQTGSETRLELKAELRRITEAHELEKGEERRRHARELALRFEIMSWRCFSSELIVCADCSVVLCGVLRVLHSTHFSIVALHTVESRAYYSNRSS
jgi:hypothetical protein